MQEHGDKIQGPRAQAPGARRLTRSWSWVTTPATAALEASLAALPAGSLPNLSKIPASGKLGEMVHPRKDGVADHFDYALPLRLPPLP
jgi:hypothetical protein